MPWVKFSDDWYDDLELVEAGPAAMLAWVTGISWCARNLTDGRLPAGQIPRLADWSALGTTAEQVIAPLVESGRLQAIEGGYLIINYLNFQPSKEQVIAEREAAKARAAKSRGSAPNVQRTYARSADPPVPVPDKPSPPSSTSDLVPADVWTEVARKKLTTANNVGNATAWCRKAAQNARDEHRERAEWIWTTYDITPGQLADVIAAGGSSPLLNSLRKREAS